MKLIPSLLTGFFIAISSPVISKSNAIPVTDVLALATGKASQTNTVMQYGSIEVTAGNLKTVLADQLATKTSLTLKGTIDARDFKTMRDDMPALTEIDLSDVAIVAYTGTNGTYDQSNYYFPENSIPYFAFCNPNTGYPKSVLVSITFPSTTTSIGGSAFWDCDGLTSITIPSSVTSIGPDAFWDCDRLTSITIPSSVTTIGRHAFCYCSGLTSITIPSSVISIEDGAFLNSGLIYVDESNPNYSSIDGILFNKLQTQLIQCPVSKEGDYTVPSTVVSIMKRAFFNCNALTSITIPVSVTSIGTEAYYDCTGLNSINLYAISPINLDLSSYAFQNVNKTTTILNVPYGSKTKYQTANHWNNFANIIEMPGLFLSHNKLGMDANEDTAFVSISSNVSWTATSDQTWLTINPASGIAGNETITFTAKANPSTANRLATVTLVASGLASQTITLTQYGKFETTAGNLKTLLSRQLSSITSLTLHGTIDARDFRTMRDDMPALTEIDLSDVAIVAYTGTEGTCPSTWGSISYSPKEIPKNAFNNWLTGQPKRDLQSFIFPSNVNSIGSGAFMDCSGLTSFLIPASVNTIGNNAFSGCNALFTVDAENPSFSALNGILFNKGQTELIRCPVSKTGDYTIPSSVTSIGDYAFDECYKLKNITIPTSVTSIGDNAFFDCTGLKEITIPSSVRYIGGYAFGYAWFLTSIKVKWIKPLNISSSPQVFQEVNISNDCTLNVPYGSKTAYQAADQWKDFPNIVEMPGIILSSNTLNMNSIAGSAQVNLSSNIDWTATSDQSWLSINPTAGTAGSSQTITFTVMENPTWVNRTATVILSGTGIESQTITVTQKGKTEVTAGNLKSLLAGQLSTIIKLRLTGTIDARDFKTMRDDMPALTEIDLSEVTIASYTGTEGTIGEESYTYPANTIPSHAFQNNMKIATVIIPSSVTSIESYAFFNCFGLTTVTIPSSVTSIEEGAFESCRALTTVTIPSSVKSLGYLVFSGSTWVNVDANNANYTSIDGILFNKTQTELIFCPVSKKGNYTIPSTVTSIGMYAFNECTGLSSVIIPASVRSIERNAFYNCSSLSIGTIPASVTSIGGQVFVGCYGSINVDANNPNYSSIDGILFNKTQTNLMQCPVSKTGNYTIPSSVTSIGYEAFAFCKELTALTIPASVISIESGAFGYCSGLNSIYSKSIAPVDINSTSYVFYTIETTTTLHVPFGSKAAYQQATQWKDFTNIVENNPPSANAVIDQTVNENSINTLDGSISSDLDSDALTYLWTAPEGITLNSNTASKPAFTAPEVTTDTNYTFSLVVNDGWMNSTADQIIVKVKQVNKAPIANAGTDAEITERKTFQLDGRQSSDFDKDAITYKWTAPFDITLSSTTVSNPTFTAPNVDTNTTFTFSLIVNDGHVDSSADQVVITVIPNKAPIANAGTDQQVNENNLFTLDGSASTDPENDLLTYFWTAPEGITLSSNTTAKPTFTTPEVATDTNYTFSLTVYDGKSYSTADDVVISIKNVDKAPYVKNPINSISVDKASPDQIIELQTIFADDDLNDVFSYRVTSNTNDQVVTTAISGSYLTLHFSSQHNGLSEMVITANSNGKEVSSKFNVEVKIPTGIGSFKSDQKLRISPNPTNGKIKVKVDQHSQSGVELIVTDINGNTILKQVIYEKEEWVDLTGNTPGMYLLKTNSDKTNVQKVILK